MTYANERSAAGASRRCGFVAFVPSDWPDCAAGTAVRLSEAVKPFRCTPSVEAKILNATRKPPTGWQPARGTARIFGSTGGTPDPVSELAMFDLG